MFTKYKEIIPGFENMSSWSEVLPMGPLLDDTIT